MFSIKQFDNTPNLEAQLLDHQGQAVDLTGATVTFAMRSRDNGSLIITGPAVVVDAANGIVAYQWQASNTAIAGAYFGEFTVSRANNSKETYPNSGYIDIYIVRSARNFP